MDVARLIHRAAAWHRDRIAIEDGVSGAKLTFRQLEDRSNALANALIGLSERREAHVSILLGNRIEFIETDLAITKAAKVKVPIHYRLTAREREYILEHAAVETLFIDDAEIEWAFDAQRRLPALKNIVVVGPSTKAALSYEALLGAGSTRPPGRDVPADMPNIVLYTSGTTGRPKGAVLTGRSRLAATTNMWLDEIDVRASDGMIHVAPLSHGSGSKIMAYYLRGARNIVLQHFDPEHFLQTAERINGTASFMVPTMVGSLIEVRARATLKRQLRMITYGGSPIAAEKLREAVEAFGPIFVQIYGSSEAPHPVSVLTREDHVITAGKEARLSSAGREVSNVEVRLMDENGNDSEDGLAGEIWIRGENLMAGYLNDPAATAAVMRDGWYRSGDVARRDEDGYLYIVDRLRDMVISGGFNVYPAEVEIALQGHPAVLEAAVIGVPDPHWGEAVKAIVVLRPGSTTSETELIDHCRRVLASYKKPRSVEFVPMLPKGATGKIMKRQLRDKYWNGLGRGVN